MCVVQVVQRKVDIPIVDRDTCQTKIKAALNAKKPGIGDKVTISPSEVRTKSSQVKYNCRASTLILDMSKFEFKLSVHIHRPTL